MSRRGSYTPKPLTCSVEHRHHSIVLSLKYKAVASMVKLSWAIEILKERRHLFEMWKSISEVLSWLQALRDSVALWKYFNFFLFKKQFPDSSNKLVYCETRSCLKPKPYNFMKPMANLQNIWLSENYFWEG